MNLGAMFRSWVAEPLSPYFSNRECSDFSDKDKASSSSKQYLEPELTDPTPQEPFAQLLHFQPEERPAGVHPTGQERAPREAPEPPPASTQETLPVRSQEDTAPLRPKPKRRLHWIGRREEEPPPPPPPDPPPQEEEVVVEEEEVVEEKEEEEVLPELVEVEQVEEEPDLDPGPPEIASPVQSTRHTLSPGSPSPARVSINSAASEDRGLKSLKSLYERQTAGMQISRREDSEGGDSEPEGPNGSYQDEIKSARNHLRAALGNVRKELQSQGTSKFSSSMVERVDQIIKELARAKQPDKYGRLSSPVAPSRTSAFPMGNMESTFGPGRFSGLGARQSSVMSGGGSGSPTNYAADYGADDAQEEEGEEEGEEDYDSDDEDAMLKRYRKNCSPQRLEMLKLVLEGEGQSVPNRGEEEDRSEERRSKAKKPTAFEKAMKEEVDTYQSIMKERLARLGVDGSKSKFRSTMDPAEAVKDAVLKYHATCTKIGKMYAFQKPNAQEEGLDMMERRKLLRFVRDLKDEDPDRYEPQDR